MGYIERKRWALFGLPWTFTKYTIDEEMLTTDRGLLKTSEDDCYMYKIVDVKLTVSLIERIFGLGTVHCYTGDTTDKVINLVHIKHSKEIKNYILENSEKMRLKRRTISTMNLTSGLDNLDMLEGLDDDGIE